MTADLAAGFGDPVHDAQACFRAVLDAMARPGHIRSVGGVSAPPPLCDATGALLLTLLDHETPVWLDPEAEAARAWISFHTGAPFESLGRAMFAIGLSLPDLAALPTGWDEVPEASATVILQVASLAEGRHFLLQGPGLRTPQDLWVAGLPDDFASTWQRNHALFPRGVDLILCDGNTLAALPRSVAIKEP